MSAFIHIKKINYKKNFKFHYVTYYKYSTFVLRSWNVIQWNEIHINDPK